MDTFDPYLVTGHLHPGDYDDPDFQEPLRPRDYDALINTGGTGGQNPRQHRAAIDPVRQDLG